jgi:hypothetical protein
MNLVGCVLLIFVCVVLLCVLMFCDVCYEFRIKTMFGASLPTVVCKRAHILFTLFVFVCVKWCPTYIVLVFFILLSSYCVPYAARFSELSIFDCPSVFFNVYLY